MKKVLLSNPTPQQREKILRDELVKVGRLEDYDHILTLLSPPPDITTIINPGQLKGRKIGIIGGGLGGLSAGFELRSSGADITVFEPIEDRIGGRVYTYYFDEEKKYYGELGPMRIPISHETTWYYIDRFHLPTHPFIQENPNAFIYVHNTRIRNTPKAIEEKLYPLFPLTPKERNTPWTKLYDYAINYSLNMLPPNIRKEILMVLPKYNPQYGILIDESIRQNFQCLKLSQGAIDLIASIDPLTGAILYLSQNEILLDFYPLAYSVLYRIEGGNVNLPLAFYKSLVSTNPKEYKNIPIKALGNVNWKGGTWVTGIYERSNRKVGVKYKERSKKGDFFEEFDYVICAVPYSVLRTMEINPFFSNKKMEAIREINYVNSQKTLFLCKKRFWEEQKIYGGISYTDLPINEIIYPSDYYYDSIHNKLSSASHHPGVITASYNFELDTTRLGNIQPELRFDSIKRQVEKVHGLQKDFLDNLVLDHKTVVWDNEPWFRGCISLFYPQQKSIFSYEMLKPEYHNKVFFAGEHISQTHGWMQGALYTGKLAAYMAAKAARER